MALTGARLAPVASVPASGAGALTDRRAPPVSAPDGHRHRPEAVRGRVANAHEDAALPALVKVEVRVLAKERAVGGCLVYRDREGDHHRLGRAALLVDGRDHALELRALAVAALLRVDAGDGDEDVERERVVRALLDGPLRLERDREVALRRVRREEESREARARFAALLLSADAPKGDFAIALETKGPVKKRTDDAFPFDVLIPVSGVYAEERGDGKRAKLELMIAAVDEEGLASEPMVIPFSVTIDKAAADGSFFRKDANFNLDKRWKGRIFVGVRDTATNRLGAVAMPI